MAAEIGLIEDLAAESSEFQETICEVLQWPTPQQFHEIALDLTGNAFARHRDAMRLREKYPDIWTEEREEYIPEMTAFIEQHGPLLVENDHIDPELQQFERFLQKSYEAALANIMHSVMAAKEPVPSLDVLFPPGLGEDTLGQLARILCELDWADPRRLLHLDAIA